MGVILPRFDTLPIGRQITRTITGRTESGVVGRLEYHTACTSVYHVDWKTPDNKNFAEKLALSTIQSYYGNSDSYVDEPFVSDEIRLLQRYHWDESKCPKKDTKAWDEAVHELHGDNSTKKSPFKLSKGRKGSGLKEVASAAARNAAKASETDISTDHQAKKQKTSIESPRGIARSLKQHVMSAANIMEGKIKEAPQVLGQAISDALPKSSKKVSTHKPAVSTGTTDTVQHLTEAAQKAQQAIQAMSPAKGSGTGSKAQKNQKQAAPATRRASSRHVPQTVTAVDSDGSVDIEGKKNSSGLAHNLKQIASSLSAAPSSQAQTSEQGLSFEATALQGQAGHDGVVSPPHTSATAPDQDEEMLELPAGSRPPRIPRSSTITEGDVLVEEYSAEDYDADADYVVDFIVADRTKGKKKEYLVKWKGYELDPTEWTPRANLEEVEALEVWLNRHKQALSSITPSKGKQAGTRRTGRQ